MKIGDKVLVHTGTYVCASCETETCETCNLVENEIIIRNTEAIIKKIGNPLVLCTPILRFGESTPKHVHMIEAHKDDLEAIE